MPTARNVTAKTLREPAKVRRWSTTSTIPATTPTKHSFAPSGGACGDGTCDDSEDEQTCPEDCAPSGGTCGDGTCDAAAGEDAASCPEDCDANQSGCGDGVCDGMEYFWCADDCCGDGQCGEGEQFVCPEDCP